MRIYAWTIFLLLLITACRSTASNDTRNQGASIIAADGEVITSMPGGEPLFSAANTDECKSLLTSLREVCPKIISDTVLYAPKGQSVESPSGDDLSAMPESSGTCFWVADKLESNRIEKRSVFLVALYPSAADANLAFEKRIKPDYQVTGNRFVLEKSDKTLTAISEGMMRENILVNMVQMAESPDDFFCTPEQVQRLIKSFEQ